jgi:hypothetical protein
MIRRGTGKLAWRPAFGLATALLFATGCATAGHPGAAAYGPGTGREKTNPAPISRMKKDEAVVLAKLWVALDLAHRSYTTVAPTGSMLPVLDSNSILLIESITGAELRGNDIAIYESADRRINIVHRAKEVTPDGVYFEGDNNSFSDGWIKPDKIRWRIAGILYTAP